MQGTRRKGRGPGIRQWFAPVRARKRIFAHIALGWLLVLGLAGCGGEGETYEPAATTAAGTYAPAATMSVQTTAAYAEDLRQAPATHVEATMVTRVREEAMAEAALAEEASAQTYPPATVAPTTTIFYGSSSAPPTATNFRDYRQSRFVSTAHDRTSTFSLDTDRTSFQLALNWAREGYEVDPDSVRAEEWINAFDYGYDYPTHLDSFAIVTDLVRHPLDDRRHLARIGFQAPEFRDDRPLNVTLVLDASGSMRDGNRVAIAREAAESIRRGLTGRDRIAVVHFTDDVIDAYTVEHSRPDDR